MVILQLRHASLDRHRAVPLLLEAMGPMLLLFWIAPESRDRSRTLGVRL